MLRGQGTGGDAGRQAREPPAAGRYDCGGGGAASICEWGGQDTGAVSVREGVDGAQGAGDGRGRSEKGEKGLIKVTRLTQGVAETQVLAPEAAVLPDDILVVEPPGL